MWEEREDDYARLQREHEEAEAGRQEKARQRREAEAAQVSPHTTGVVIDIMDVFWGVYTAKHASCLALPGGRGGVDKVVLWWREGVGSRKEKRQRLKGVYARGILLFVCVEHQDERLPDTSVSLQHEQRRHRVTAFDILRRFLYFIYSTLHGVKQKSLIVPMSNSSSYKSSSVVGTYSPKRTENADFRYQRKQGHRYRGEKNTLNEATALSLKES